MLRVILLFVLLVLSSVKALPCGIDWPASYLSRDRESLPYSPAMHFETEISLIIKDNIPESDFELVHCPGQNLSARAAALKDIEEAIGADSEDRIPSFVTKYVRIPIRRVLVFTISRVSKRPETVIKSLPVLGRFLNAKKYKTLKNVLREDYDKARALAAQGKTVKFASSRAELLEFELYLAGVSEMNREAAKLGGKADSIPPSWTKLLALPAISRKYNTVRTLYMVGNIHSARGRIEEAHAAYKKLREAAAGRFFNDSEGLALASFKRDYQCERHGDPVKRLKAAFFAYAYLSNWNSGEKTAFMLNELDIFSDFKVYPQEEIQKLLDDPLCREILAAWVCENGTAKEFLALLRGRPVKCAERGALIAYNAGDYALAKKWLAPVPEDSLYKHWLTAKLLRMEGKWSEASAELRKWLELYQEEDDASSAGLSRIYLDGYDKGLHGMKGDVLISNGEAAAHLMNFQEAMHCFLMGDAWLDASYLAERFMSVEELRKYVDSRCSAATNPTDLSASADPNRNKLRYLLARRLMRLGRWDDAFSYMPKKLLPEAKEYVQHLRLSEDKSLSQNERALHLYNAGKLARWRGMELFGTEHEPDVRAADGNTDQLVSFKPDDPKSLAIYQSNAPKPDRRYHYRYIASDLLFRAAKLAEEPSLKAASLLLGGNCIKVRDTGAANPFYVQLALMKSNLPLVERTRGLRWFPSTLPPELEMEICSKDPASIYKLKSVLALAMPK